MANAEPAAFWSYAHEDNEKSGGAILALAKLISDEYSLLKGEELRMFVDTDVEWGEEWRQRIKNALVATTFFIPIVTPRYFTREECLRELFDFARRAVGLGVSDLVCPILYVPVDGLTEDSSDAAKAQIARAQYKDWTKLRLEGAGSAAHIEAVHELAVRLAEVADRVAARQVTREGEQSDEDMRTSLAETLDAARQLLPQWQAAHETDSVVLEQFLAADKLLEARRRKARRRTGGARFLVAARQVEEYLPLMTRRAELMGQMLQIATELGPLLTRMFEIAREHPEEKPLVDELWGEVVAAASDAYVQRDQSKWIAIEAWARRHSHETRGMLTLAETAARRDRMVREGNAQFQAWEDDYATLVDAIGGPVQGSAPDDAEAQT
jgi:hypothetical protein